MLSVQRIAVVALVSLIGGPFAWAGLPEYQAAVKAEPALVSYYPFDTDVAPNVADAALAGAHAGTLQGTAAFAAGISGTDQALVLDGGGWVNLGPVADFAFPDGTGTVEAWVKPNWPVDGGGADYAWASSRDAGVRYSCHIGWNRRYANSYSGPSWSHSDVDLTQDRWYHVAYVFGPNDALHIYVDGHPYGIIYDWRGDDHVLGLNLDQAFEIGASGAGGNGENFNGQIDEVAIYSEALSGPAIAAHVKAFAGPGVSLAPASATFRLPDDAGPKNVTVGLSSPAPAGGTPVTLTYNAVALAVTTNDGAPIASGDTVTVPANQSSVVVKVSALALGETGLVATAAGLSEAVAIFNVTRAAITVSPGAKLFTSPGDLGPLNVTLGLSGAVAGASGVPLKLTYDATIISVAAGDGSVIPSGGSVGVPAGANQVVVKVSGAGVGWTVLRVTNAAFVTGEGGFGTQLAPSANLLAYQAAVRSEGSLIGYYTFDNDVTGVADQKPTGTPHDGTLIGEAFFGGRPEGGRALALTGAGHVNFGAVADYAFTSGTGTIELWIRPMAASGTFGSNPFLVGCREEPYGTRWGVHLNNPRDGWGTWQNTNYDVPGYSLAADRWYHIVAVFNAGTISYYTNGNFVTTITRDLPGDPQWTFQIGSSWSHLLGREQWIGGIDEVAVYSSALPREQILAHWEAMYPPAPPSVSTLALAAYQNSVFAEPSLLSYYTFEGDSTAANGVTDKKGPHHGSASGVVEFTQGFAGGGALNLHGMGLVALGNVEDFKFADNTGTVEAWVNTAALNVGNKSFFSGRDTVNRYTLHVGTSDNVYRVTTPAGSATGPFPGGLQTDTWYHVAAVFDNGNKNIYINGLPAGSPLAQALGDMAVANFQIGAGTAAGAFQFMGMIDELAVYGDALSAAQIAAHYRTVSLDISPKDIEFLLPAQPGPVNATISLPTGLVAPGGGFPVMVTFDPTVISVNAGAGPIASGGAVIVPAGASNVSVALTALGLGTTSINISAPGMISSSAQVRVLLAGQGVVIVDDHFDDNPASDPDLDLTALGINANGAGAGWNAYMQGKTERERGTSWEVLGDGGDWSLAALNGKTEDEFKVLTADGARIEWVINDVTVTADNTGNQPQFPGGELADCRHEFGIVSANRPTTGSNELYSNTAGGLYVNIFYWANGTLPTQNITVTGNVRAVNSAHPGGDTEDLAGLETVATFTLTGVTMITPQNPLSFTMKVNQNGWRIGFPESAGVVWQSRESGVTVGAGGELNGGWDANSLNDAVLTTELAAGAFAYAHFQNMNNGRGAGAVDQVKICIGCVLSGDCPDPFADADRDGDVDMDDYARFQACFSGASIPAASGCRCFERQGAGNQDVSAADYAAFVACFSGPSVPADKGCDGN